MTPKQFFEDWLPREAARLGVIASGAPETHVRVTLEGSEGGVWDLQIHEGTLHVGPRVSTEPQVAVVQSVDDWKALVLGDDDSSLAPQSMRPTDLLFLDPLTRQVLQTVRGTIEFRITQYHARTWRMRAKFGDAPMKADPDATITVDAGTYRAMATRKLPPPEAYFSGKIVIGGDAGLALQLGMAMLPRFAT